jgi:hypothetical protein
MQVSEILHEIDSEIARLQEARRLLAGEGEAATSTRGRKPAEAPKARRGRRKLTAEGRKRLSEALKARWAERKKKATKGSK